jgi:hypothetical protein
MQLFRKAPIACMTKTSTTVRTLWALVVPVRWSHDALYLLLNAPDEEQKKQLTRAWQKNKLADLKRIGITVSSFHLDPMIHRNLWQAALVTGVISSAFSWYIIEHTSWKTKGMWYSGLISALTSISTAGLHINALLRLSCMADWEQRLQITLGRPTDDLNGKWRPRTFQPWIWQTPGFMLKLSVILFIVGLAVLVWEQALATGKQWGSDEIKVRVLN